MLDMFLLIGVRRYVGITTPFHILALIVRYAVNTHFPGQTLYFQFRRTPIAPF